VPAQYEADAVLVPKPGRVVGCVAAIRESLLGFLAPKLPIHLDGNRALTKGDVALVSSSWSLKGTGPDGSPVDLSSNTTELVRR
jgi:ketosteroid isomerase-like protein